MGKTRTLSRGITRVFVTCCWLTVVAAGPAVEIDRSDSALRIASGVLDVSLDLSKSSAMPVALRMPPEGQSLLSALACSLYYPENRHWVAENWLKATAVDLERGEGVATVTADCGSFGGFHLRKTLTLRDASEIVQVCYDLEALQETAPQLIVPVNLACAPGLDRLITPAGEVPAADVSAEGLGMELAAEWYAFRASADGAGLAIVPISWPQMHGVNYVRRGPDGALSLAMRLHPMRAFQPGDSVRFAYNIAVFNGDAAAAVTAARAAGAGPIEYPPAAAQAKQVDAVALGSGLRATVCPATAAAPVLDGMLDEPCWVQGGVMDRFMAIDGTRFAEAPTTARVLHDSAGVYVAVRCAEPMMEQVQANAVAGGGQVWTDDCVELFIDPDGDGKAYTHLIINAAGVTQDNFPGERAVTHQWRAAAARGVGFWSVEAFIPYSDLEISPPAPGQCWRMNVCRSRLPKREATCWCPTSSGFHVPERFGVVAFGSPLPAVTHISTGLDATATVQSLIVGVQNPGPTEAVLSGSIELLREGRTLVQAPVEATVAPGAVRQVAVPYSLELPGLYELRLALGSAEGRGDVLVASFPGTVHSLGLNSAIFPAEKDNNRLMIAKGTVQHAFFIPANHSDNTYEQFAFVLTVPEGIEVINATGDVHTAYYRASLASREPVEREGMGMVRYVFEADRGLGKRDITRMAFYNGWCPAFIPSDDLPEGDYPFFFNLVSGDEAEIEHRGTFTILPRPVGARLKHLKLGACAWTICPTEEFWRRLLDTYVTCGINMLDAWISQLDRKWSDPIHERNIESWRGMWWFWWNDEYLKAHPEHAAISSDGKPAERLICPQIMAARDNDAIAGVMDPILEAVADGRYIGSWWDLEGPASFSACFCPRCLSAFRESAGIPADEQLTPLAIQTAHADEWLDFACLQSARIAERMKQYALDRGSDWKLAVYSAVQNEHTRRAYRVDWTTLTPVIDVVTPSFYSAGVGDLGSTFTEGNMAFVDLIRAIKDVPIYNTLSVGHDRQSHYISDGRITRMQIIKSIAFGADGTWQWWWGPTDGRHYTAYADASRTLAPIEGFFVDGVMKPALLAGAPVAGTTRIAWEQGEQLLVMLFNDTTSGRIEATADVPAGYGIRRQDHDGGIALRDGVVHADVEPLFCRWVVLSR